MGYQLTKLEKFKGPKGPVVLLILDGIGIGKKFDGNAIWRAEPQNLNSYMKEAEKNNLYCELKAHGPTVGLPSDGDMGNSEVGHNALGAGQIYSQGAKLVNEAIENGSFFQTENWEKIVGTCAKSNKTLHFIGLLSDGNVHSHIDQLFNMMDGSVKSGIKKIRIHPLLDGRDVAPDSGLIYIEKLENKLKELQGVGVDAKIGSGGGRMYVTMDRYYSDWNIVERGWNAHVHGKLADSEITQDYPGYFKNATEAIHRARELWPDKLDQFNPPFVIVDESGNPVGKIEDGDSVINFNFRGDRAIEISETFELNNFDGFDRGARPKVNYAGLLEYDGDRHLPSSFMIPPPNIENISALYLAEEKIKSYAIAETHKYGHVTYFWNGNRTGYVDETNEKFVEVKSDPSDMIEGHPDMKIYEVTDKLIDAIKSNEFKFVRANFANGDMVGHTGNIDSAIKAVSDVDVCLKKTVDATLEADGIIIVTADHGNAEEMLDKKGKTVTSHTLNPVPFFIIDSNYDGQYQVSTTGIEIPGIPNVTATVLNLLGFEAPDFYEKSLIEF